MVPSWAQRAVFVFLLTFPGVRLVAVQEVQYND